MTATKAAHEPWICPTCAVPVTTRFCGTCSEAPPNARDLTLRGLVLQLANAVTNIDGKLLRSFSTLILRPGRLTAAYERGQRSPYFRPFPLFLITNVMFFALQSFTDFRIFSTTLEMHLYNQAWSELAQQLVIKHLKDTGTTLDLYRPIFDQAVIVNAKSLIGLMVPALTVLLPVVFYRAHKPMAVHAVFALHFYAFLLALFCLPLIAMIVERAVGGDGKLSQDMDDALSIALVLACAAYLHGAARTAYGAHGLWRVASTVLLAISVAAIFLAYRFVLLVITLQTT